MIYCSIRIIRIMRVLHLHFGVSGLSGRRVTVRKFFWFARDLLRDCSQSIGISEVFPGNFSDFCSISDISIFFENLSYSRASCLTNIYILIREVLEKQATQQKKQTTAVLYFFLTTCINRSVFQMYTENSWIIIIYPNISGLIIGPHNDLLPVCLMAQLVQHCTGIAEVRVRILVQA